jgi:hypothetical protein
VWKSCGKRGFQSNQRRLLPAVSPVIKFDRFGKAHEYRSVFEEAQVLDRLRLLVVAGLLTVLEAMVFVCRDWSALVTWPAHHPICSLRILLAALQAVSLMNLWTLATEGMINGWIQVGGQAAVLIREERRGRVDV